MRRQSELDERKGVILRALERDAQITSRYGNTWKNFIKSVADEIRRGKIVISLNKK